MCVCVCVCVPRGWGFKFWPVKQEPGLMLGMDMTIDRENMAVARVELSRV